MRETTVLIRGTRYRVRISGSGFPVLLLHGFTGSADVFAQGMQTQPDFQWIAPDLLGHGQTDSPSVSSRYVMEEQTQDLVELMSYLGYGEFACVGYSMGGRVALSLSVTYSECVKALVLESSSPGLEQDAERRARSQRDRNLAQRIEQIGVERFVSEWEQIPLFASQMDLSPATLAKQRKTRMEQTERGLANSLRGMGTGEQPSYWRALQRLQMPVLLITGQRDHKFTEIAEKMTEKLVDARHVSVAGAGHTVHLETPQKFWSEVSAFLLVCLS